MADDGRDPRARTATARRAHRARRARQRRDEARHDRRAAARRGPRHGRDHHDIPGWERRRRARCASSRRTCSSASAPITTAEQARAAVDAGAHFCVSPRLAPDARARARRRTACRSSRAGSRPPRSSTRRRAASPSSSPPTSAGSRYLESLLAVAPDARIMPTGGIALSDVATWLAAGAIAVGVGSDLTAAGDIAARVAEALGA